MNMLALEVIGAEEAEQFVEQHPLGNFLQSAPLAQRRAEDGWQSFAVADRGEDGKVRGFAMLYARPVLAWKEFECQQGPLIDYEDSSYVTDFFAALRLFARQHGGYRLTINPPVLANQRTIDGDLLPGTQTKYAQFIEAAKFHHVDPRITDANPVQLRWYFTKDLSGLTDRQALLKDVDQQTRWAINKAARSGVRITQLQDAEGLESWLTPIVETARRLGFNARNLGYYQGLFRHFNRKQAIFAAAELPRSSYQAFLQKEVEALKKELKATDQAMSGKRRDISERIAAYEKKLAGLDELFEGREALHLSSAVFMHTGPQLVYFMSGNSEQYKSFGGAYALQDWALTYAIEQGIDRYNFYGTKGVFSGHPDQQGVYEFKRGFGGVVEEQIGYFVATPRPLIARFVDILSAAKSLLRR